MLSTTRHFVKEYIERGVQTDLVPLKTQPAELPISCMDSPPYSQRVDACSASVPSPPTPGRTRTSTQDDGAYSQCQTDVSFDSTSSTADRSMTTTTRAFKMETIPPNRPTTLFNRQSSFRTVSLPEATPKFRMKTVLEKTTARVVSMPMSAIRDSLSDGLDAQSIVGDPFVSEDEHHTRVRVRSHATDVPHTPSTPSSPDSVVIIANTSNQLSNEFLKTRIDEETSAESSEEGWITWTQSPPRPIPALHGPLSLPYARCPSGAEGTIIEEPDSLPRVIWGLDSDDMNGRTQVRAISTQSSAGKPPAESSGDKGRASAKTRNKEGQRPLLPQTAQPRGVEQSGHSTQEQQQNVTAPCGVQELPHPPEFILKHSEPIDLGRLLGSSVDKTPLEVVPDGAVSGMGWQASYSSGLPTPELVHDLSPEMVFSQDRFKTHGLTIPSGSASDIHGLSNASIPATMHSGSPLESLKSSRSPILLEDLAPRHLAYAQGSLSRTSALDISQKYRQQHLQSILPTPPDSTSPIWSSTFSPYQGGVLSPELLAAAGLSQMKSGYLTSQVIPPRLDSSQNLLRPVPNGFGNSALGPARKATLGSLSPAALINANGQKLPPRLAAEYVRRRAMPDIFPEGFQLQNELGFQYLSPIREASHSPGMPKAPPNTPHASVSPYALRHPDVFAINQPPFIAAPPSSTAAHELQNICLPQHIRSVPLSRLVQRRLSTVPEEDHTSSADTGRTAPSSGRINAQGPTTSPSGLHLFLSPSGRANVNAAHLDMLGEHVGARYGAGDVGVSDATHTISYGVKLPGAVHGKGPGPVAGREGQFVKEASRRQGTGNINSDGGKRGDGGRGRGHKRGGRGRKGRGGGDAHGIHGTRNALMADWL
uniref:Sulfate adenylyltransferase (Sulfate adenylate transferase) (SAT)) n=1 Tax=Ganoderma boninense TaxID=34458 RepID=A0A5K1JXB3_9APHY|nr:Sulfate adenylyltransferase (EC (ATP-sulfurylase) (Sulfate adenylate transferase) (SAT) [Ganoderma boninense]